MFARLGMFITVLVGYGFVNYVEHGWQYVQGVAALPALVQLGLAYMIPESPKWLVGTKGDDAAARAVLESVRNPGDDVDKELDDIIKRSQEHGEAHEASWSEVFEWGTALRLGVALMIIQTQTGANSTFYYSSNIFGFAGFDDAILGSVIVIGVSLLVTIVSDSLVERLGRRPLMIGGTCLACGAALTMSLALWAGDALGEAQGTLAVVAMVLFVTGWGIGLGAVTWVVLAEIVPTYIRSKTYSLFVTVMWINGFLDGFLTLTAIDGLGGVTASMDDPTKTQHQKHGCGKLYMIYSCICGASVVFMFYNLPETKGATPESLRPPEEVVAVQATRKAMGSSSSTSTDSGTCSLVNHNSAPKKKKLSGPLTESLISSHNNL